LVFSTSLEAVDFNSDEGKNVVSNTYNGSVDSGSNVAER
jgi:hypothetical protein